MSKDMEPERPEGKPVRKQATMVEHAARQRGSGVMISPSAVLTGIIFLLLFALACALQVGELKRANKSAQQGEGGHDHDEVAEEAATDEDIASQQPQLRKETVEEVRAARTRQADEGMASFDMAEARRWAQLPGSELTPVQAEAIRALKALDNLRDEDANVRLSAGFELYGMTGYWHLFLVALEDENADTRRIAANCLGYAPWPAAAAKLEAVGIGDPDPLVRENAILALGMGPAQPRSVPVLVEALGDDNLYIARAAAVALADMAVLGVSESREGLLVAALSDDPEVRGQAMTGLYHLADRGLSVGDDGQTALEAALDDRESDIARQYAVRALALLERTDLADRFLALADRGNEPGWQVRFHAARAMGLWFPDAAQQQPGIVGALRRISVEDPDQAVQFAAMASLKDMGFDPGKWNPSEARS